METLLRLNSIQRESRKDRYGVRWQSASGDTALGWLDAVEASKSQPAVKFRPNGGQALAGSPFFHVRFGALTTNPFLSAFAVTRM